MALSDVTCRTTKAAVRLQKLSDGGGLQLWIPPSGAKLWRLAYRYGGRQKLLALGPYPLVSLASARIARDVAKRLLVDGVDPSEARKEQRAEQMAGAQTFRLIGAEFLEKLKAEKRAKITLDKNEWLLSLAYPSIGDRPITTIKPADILQVLRGIERRGKYHTAHRLRSTMGAVFRFAIATDRAEADPTIALRDALVSYTEVPRPALTTEKPFGALLRSIAGYDGQPVTRIALQLMALLFPRPGELRKARWCEFNVEEGIWSVPPERMKGRLPHFVPLSRQAMDMLRELREITGHENLVFPGVNRARCISDGTLNSALRRLGYDTSLEHCSHGFRSSASTLLNETGKWHRDAIERQLAHVESNSVRRVYARGEHWAERVKMMQWWADECDRLRGGGKVVRLISA